MVDRGYYVFCNWTDVRDTRKEYQFPEKEGVGMGFTIEDMLLMSKDKYRMKIVAGKNGWSNSVSFLLMMEAPMIIRNFTGKELAVTTGLGFQSEEAFVDMVQQLIDHNASGLIVNTGCYITHIPQKAIELCDENDLPMLTVPWDVYLADMIKDLTIRVFLQGSTDEQISEALIRVIEHPEDADQVRQDLLAYFDTDGDFQIFVVYNNNLDKMDTVERKRIAYRLQLYLTNLTHNGHFFYYDSSFVVLMNAVDQETARRLMEDFQKRAGKKMPEEPITIGCGTQVQDISNLSLSYKRAKAASKMACAIHKPMVFFDEMGVYRLLYSVKDQRLLREMSTEVLKPLLDYDKKHEANYVETLELYLKLDQSVQAVAAEMFTHRNTIMYRIKNIKKLLGSELKTENEKLPLEIACMIMHMGV